MLCMGVVELVKELVDFSAAVVAIGIPEDASLQDGDIDFVLVWVDFDDDAVAGEIGIVLAMLNAVDKDFSQKDFNVIFKFLATFDGAGEKVGMHPVEHVVGFVDVRVDLRNEDIPFGIGVFAQSHQEEVVRRAVIADLFAEVPADQAGQEE